MTNSALLTALALLLSSCQGSDFNAGKVIQEFFSILIMGGFAYSAGILALGYLTDIKWVQRQAEERGKNLIFIAIVTLGMIIFDGKVQEYIQKAVNLFGIK